MMLMPSEEKMLDLLKQKKIPIDLIKANPKRRLIIENKLQAFLSQDPTLKFLAQKVRHRSFKLINIKSNINSLNADAFTFFLFSSLAVFCLIYEECLSALKQGRLCCASPSR